MCTRLKEKEFLSYLSQLFLVSDLEAKLPSGLRGRPEAIICRGTERCWHWGVGGLLEPHLVDLSRCVISPASGRVRGDLHLERSLLYYILDQEETHI